MPPCAQCCTGRWEHSNDREHPQRGVPGNYQLPSPQGEAPPCSGCLSPRCEYLHCGPATLPSTEQRGDRARALPPLDRCAGRRHARAQKVLEQSGSQKHSLVNITQLFFRSLLLRKAVFVRSSQFHGCLSQARGVQAPAPREEGTGAHSLVETMFQVESQGVAMLEGGMVLLKTQLPGTPGNRLAKPALQIGVEAKRPRQPNRDPGFSSAGPGTGAQGARRSPHSVRVMGWEVATALLFSIPTTPALSLSARPALSGTLGTPAWTTANQ